MIFFAAVKMLHNAGMNTETIQSVYEAAGGIDAILRRLTHGISGCLRTRWLAMRSVMDFTHSIPSVSLRIGRRRLVDPRCTLTSTAMRPQSSVFTAVTGDMKRWINVQSPVSIRRWKMLALIATSSSGACCTITLPGRPRAQWRATTGRLMMSRTECTFQNGLGMDSLLKPKGVYLKGQNSSNAVGGLFISFISDLQKQLSKIVGACNLASASPNSASAAMSES